MTDHDHSQPKNPIATAIDAAEEITASEAPTDLEEAGLSQGDALGTVCDEAAVWRSPEGDTFASVRVNGHAEHYAIRSRRFQSLMRHQLARRFTRRGRPASANENVMRDALNAIDARALAQGVTHAAVYRMRVRGSHLYRPWRRRLVGRESNAA